MIFPSFHSHGGTPSHPPFFKGFFVINHPAIGIAPFQEIPISQKGDSDPRAATIIPGAFHSHGGSHFNAWFIVENPMKKWMMTWGTPIVGNPHLHTINHKFKIHCKHLFDKEPCKSFSESSESSNNNKTTVPTGNGANIQSA